MVDIVTQISPAPTQTTVDPVAVQAAPTIVAPQASVASTEVVQPVSVVEATTTPEVTPKAPETLLGAPEVIVEPIKPVVVAPEPVKAVEPAKVIENKEGSQSVEPAPPPTYESFKAPEGITLAPETIGKFTSLLAQLETDGKADHATVQKFGQEAVDFYIAEVSKSVTDYNKSQQTAWDKQKTEWKESFMKDPEIGGERSSASIEAARTFLRTHGGTEQQQTEFRSLMETSGLGNHPAMIRLLAKANETMGEGKPLAAIKPTNTSVKSKVQTMYGSMGNSYGS